MQERQETWVQSLGQKDALGEEMATSILAWRASGFLTFAIPLWLAFLTSITWVSVDTWVLFSFLVEKKWKKDALRQYQWYIILIIRIEPGESHGQRSLVATVHRIYRVGHDWSDLARMHIWKLLRVDLKSSHHKKKQFATICGSVHFSSVAQSCLTL